MDIISIAQVCHEVNRAYCEAMGDHSQPAWEDAPEWQQDSAKNGVRFHLNEEHGPADSHQAWMDQKIKEGWVYGDTKDPVAKTHPCLVPFSKLPVEQQAKDYIFRAIVHAIREAEVASIQRFVKVAIAECSEDEGAGADLDPSSSAD